MDVHTKLQYLEPSSKPLRRYIAPGGAFNTGTFQWNDVVVRDARPARSDFSLDNTGFCLVDAKSDVTDWDDRAQLETVYAEEIERLIKELTGADEVMVFEPTLRRKSTTPKWQPFGAEAHIDYSKETAEGLFSMFLEKKGMSRSNFTKFQCINVWRALSPAPQDYPLGVCDARSVTMDEFRPCYRIHLQKLPDPEDLPIEEPNPTPAADMFEYRPQHQWWYFSDMGFEEALVFKLYDSEDLRKRCPHTAFNSLRVGAKPRESIEIRTVAGFG